MRFLPAALLVLAVSALGLRAQPPSEPYRLVFDSKQDIEWREPAGKTGIHITVYFAVKRDEKAPVDPRFNYKVIIEELDLEGKGHFRLEVPVARPRITTEEMAVVLTMDTSGSMGEFGRMKQAQKAATTFIKALPPQADSGLILFNDKVHTRLPPPEKRSVLQERIDKTPPSGGTAYLDATAAAVDMLKVPTFANKQKAVVLMTDGDDINSEKTQEQVIALAKQAGIRVYTIGIGRPGKQQPVSSILVLDRSGSMSLRANDKDKLTKIEALKSAADRFVNGIRAPRRCAILDFGDAPLPASPFTSEKVTLKSLVKKLIAQGETCLFDAVYDALMTLEADNPPGKRAIVALTDGIDNKSRRRVEEVIALAKASKVPLFLLGFGRKGELDIARMEQMAKETGGKFYHADDQDKLVRYFEDLYTRIHDDGVNEEALRELAVATGGKYYPAENIKDLQFILEKVTQEIREEKKPYTFPSIRPTQDGTPRRVQLRLRRIETDVASGGNFEDVSVETARIQTQGVVIAEMHPSVYLILLGILGALIVLPGMLRRKSQT